MSLTPVLSVAYPFAKVTADSVGGAEQVMSMVVDGLVRAGHRSLVLAARGSTCEGELLAMDLPEGVLDDAARRRTTRGLSPCREAGFGRSRCRAYAGWTSRATCPTKVLPCSRRCTSRRTIIRAKSSRSAGREHAWYA